jgi:hypothetical protein
LARLHALKAISRSNPITLRLSRQAFGSFGGGSRIAVQLPRLNPDNGWTFDETIILRVEEITVDENFNLEVKAVLADALEVSLNPGGISTAPPTDDFPEIFDIEAQVLVLPAISEPGIFSYYRGITPLTTITIEPVPCTAYEQLPPGSEVDFSNEAVGLTGDNWNVSVLPPLEPGYRYTTASFTMPTVGYSPAFQNYTELDFELGFGNLFVVGGVIVRARLASISGLNWVFSDLIYGLVGTWVALPTPSTPLIVDQTYEIEPGTPQEFGVTRLLRVVHPLALPSSSPQASFAQSKFTVTPHKPTGLEASRQPSGAIYVTWHGHVLGQGTRVDGRHPSGISIGESYEINWDGTWVPVPTANGGSFSVPVVPRPTTIQVRQLGDYMTISPIAQVIVP